MDLVLNNGNLGCANLFAGTILSGIMSLFCCCGVTRHSADFQGNECDKRFCNFVINLCVGLAQFLTLIFCLVGWCWSVGWGITLLSVASKCTLLYLYKRITHIIIAPKIKS